MNKDENLEVGSLELPRSSGLEVYEMINPLDLPRVERTPLLSGAADGILLQGTAAERVFPGHAPAFVDDPDNVGLFPKLGVQKYYYPPAYTVGVRNVTVAGYRTILNPHNQFFTDEAYVDSSSFQHHLARMSRPDAFSNEATGLRPTDRERFFQFDPGDRPQRHIDGTAVVLCSDEPFSYGSFLFRVVPKIKTVRHLGLTQATFLAQADQKPFMDLLNFCGLPQANILPHDVKVLTRIDRALIPSMRDPHAYLDPESCDLYAELRALYGVRPSGRKVYVSRVALNQEGWSTRIMENEPQLIVKLRDIGFDVIEPENLTVRDQILAFSSASMIVGPSGSGLFNTMFCHPGTKIIDIQSEPQWIYSYTGMYASLQLNYGIFVGKADPADTRQVHRRWSINIDALLARIRTFMAE